jgi:hypothetical protein
MGAAMARLLTNCKLRKNRTEKWLQAKIFSQFFGDDNLERAVAAGEGVIMNGYVEAVPL